jgi:hypothetical protein
MDDVQKRVQNVKKKSLNEIFEMIFLCTTVLLSF